ncbi:hypothetical protein P279_15060 [Rhodobacteraceae bacterium PD-2]|nr:hypothetical protein P279_15060 [Rhodobacteraceae bacterium PD-2]
MAPKLRAMFLWQTQHERDDPAWHHLCEILDPVRKPVDDTLDQRLELGQLARREGAEIDRRTTL